MLVLERHLDECIEITVPGLRAPIRVVLCKVGNDWAKIGLDAPRNVKIMRSELVKRKRKVGQCS